MKIFSSLLIALAICTPTMAAENPLLGNTLICVVYRSEINHGAVPDVPDWRTVTQIYVTAKNMFMQNAMKEMKTGKLHTDGATAMGAEFEWNKMISGNSGLRVKFRTFATKSAEKISFEKEYTVKNTLADNVTMNVAENGQIYREGKGWGMFAEAKQSLAGGRQPAIYNTKSWYRCELKEGRHLL